MRITHCHGKPGHPSKSLRRVSCVVPKQPFFLGTTAKKSWAVVASEKTDTTGCLLARLRHGAVRKDRHEQRMLMCHRAVRKDKHERRQFRRPEFWCRQKRQTRKSVTESPIPNAWQNCSWPFGAPMLFCSSLKQSSHLIVQVQCVCPQTQASVTICFHEMSARGLGIERHQREPFVLEVAMELRQPSRQPDGQHAICRRSFWGNQAEVFQEAKLLENEPLSCWYYQKRSKSARPAQCL